MVVSLPSFGLIYSLLLLAPGFITYKLTRHFGKITSEFDNFDKGIYTVLGSGFALSVSITLFSIVIRLLSGKFWIPTPSNVESVVLAGIYLLTVPVSIINGYLVGHFLNWMIHRGDDVRNESVWRLATENANEPTQVTIFTHEGDEIWGEIYTVDQEPHGQDILLEYPLKIARNDEGEKINEYELGDYAFISQDTISQIHYETDVDV
ncbi:DUF6338 family protein [Natrinema sp. SYSU A 869]|uniref:DUF6338 family protein n=1 Tax=Natrinema sp. SYSU A 869 TaxID=2871694 RepID=UPI001CA3B386|nr:DUF6338 family protein [Natrinema sp. SYSU A 869]